MAEDACIELLGIRTRRTVLLQCFVAVVLTALSALRFVPSLNDTVSGKPEYARILTETFARQLASGAEMQSPVIVEPDEQGRCEAVKAPSLRDEEVRGILYLLTYSEQQHLTCITTYVVPIDSSKFTSLRSFTSGEGRNFGPPLLVAVKAIAESRMYHVYPPEYLKRLHWRYKPHFPLSPSEAASLRSQSYYSGATPPGDGSVSIDLDYGELRTEVAKRHENVNLVLTLLLACGVVAFLTLFGRLWLVYRASCRYCAMYDAKLTTRDFLGGSVSEKMASARREYFARQHEIQARQREAERMRALRTGWLEDLRSTLPHLSDEHLRERVRAFLESGPFDDIEQVRCLWMEVQEQVGQRTPTDKLDLLMQSVRPYCTEEEYEAGKKEAIEILNKSGFRMARAYVVAVHEQFRAHARELEELEASLSPEASDEHSNRS